MKELKTETTINASVDQVWSVLMEHDKYDTWNPFIKKISGKAERGEKLEVLLQSGPDKTMNFTPTVLLNEENNEFRWLGHLFVKGLFDGEHYFKLEAIGPNKTRFVHGENFSGLMVSVLLKMIGKDTLNGFESMNEALKKRVENKFN